jgi:hypothetical protein
LNQRKAVTRKARHNEPIERLARGKGKTRGALATGVSASPAVCESGAPVDAHAERPSAPLGGAPESALNAILGPAAAYVNRPEVLFVSSLSNDRAQSGAAHDDAGIPVLHFTRWRGTGIGVEVADGMIAFFGAMRKGDLGLGVLSRNHDVAFRPRRWQFVDAFHPPNSLDAKAGDFQ